MRLQHTIHIVQHSTWPFVVSNTIHKLERGFTTIRRYVPTRAGEALSRRGALSGADLVLGRRVHGAGGLQQRGRRSRQGRGGGGRRQGRQRRLQRARPRARPARDRWLHEPVACATCLLIESNKPIFEKKNMLTVTK